MLLRSLIFCTVLAAWAKAASAQEPPPAPPAPPTPDASPPAAPAPELPVVSITGRVIDASGKPVANVTVSVDGSAATAATDKDGRFRIDAQIGASLTIEHDGYDPSLANATSSRLDDVVMLKAG